MNKLIILYGDFGKEVNWKQQRMIDGKATCGYREYAKKFGDIIYLCPQNISKEWEHSITDPNEVIKFINKYPQSVVWSVKYSPTKDALLLSKIKNKKLYYSCNSKNRYNEFCDVSLIDTKERSKGVPNGKLWFKGKDPDYWYPSNNKKYDYILVGGRGDKNEVYFINRLDEIKENRRVIWVGGKKFQHACKFGHDVRFTDFVGQDIVRDYLSQSKVGILFTELDVEGFPQTFLEMTMCGAPVVYNINAPRNDYYFFEHNCIFSNKKNLIENAELLLQKHNTNLCREIAVQQYSIEKSYKRILECLNL